ncbi:hypothetical protein NHX12_020173 [Muraenolepis orangiensis]|uniref:Integrase catalytic domain-containing protein n=1 Tax=Muraenolepis orangiensis TaxID=630683 RepID=A0A9Q0I1N5_9TELE|nr:hypothetical protein NHX12_020173 [Muraenolepis orangiensis]
MQNILATTADRCHWDWDLMTHYALMAYRATQHSSTRLTPNILLFGKEVTEPVDLVPGLPPDNDNIDTNTPPQYVMKLRERLGLSHQLAREALGKSVERAKQQYDKNICQTQHKVGVWHLIKGTKRIKNKLVVPPPQPDLSSSDAVIGPLHLWDPTIRRRGFSCGGPRGPWFFTASYA